MCIIQQFVCLDKRLNIILFIFLNSQGNGHFKKMVSITLRICIFITLLSGEGKLFKNGSLVLGICIFRAMRSNFVFIFCGPR